MNVGLLSSASALAIVGYAGVTVYHGHLIALLDQLAKDKAFLAWMAASGVIYLLSQQETIGAPVRVITGVAILAVLLKVFSSGGLNSAFASFQSGQLSLASLFSVFGVQAGKALNIYNGPSNSTSTLPNGVTP